jgi:hypothetical protein
MIVLPDNANNANLNIQHSGECVVVSSGEFRANSVGGRVCPGSKIKDIGEFEIFLIPDSEYRKNSNEFNAT